MTASQLITLLSTFPPDSKVTIAVDDPKGKVKSLFEGDVVRVENANGVPFLVGEKD